MAFEPAWVTQQMKRMASGVNHGATRKRNVASVLQFTTEKEFADAVRLRGWRLAQIGDDYVVAPHGYAIRPIV